MIIFKHGNMQINLIKISQFSGIKLWQWKFLIKKPFLPLRSLANNCMKIINYRKS